MNKKLISLLSTGVMVLSLTGCNTSVKVFGKEIFSAQENTVQQEQNLVENLPQSGGYAQEDFDKQEVLSWLLDGNYTLSIDGVDYVYNTEEMLNAVFDNKQEYVVSRYSETEYLIQAINENEDMFITFMVEDANNSILDVAIVEFFYDKVLYEGEDASNTLPQVLYSEYFNEEDGSLSKKQQVAKEETKKEQENTSEQKQSKEQPKEEKKQETPKTCKWCYTNQLPSGAGENDKCQECQEENWNFYCGDCGKLMSLNEYWSYGHDTGFCPTCYDKYIQSTSEDTGDDHKHYYCSRCGTDVTFLNFLQNIEGFDYLCEGCLLELGY